MTCRNLKFYIKKLIIAILTSLDFRTEYREANSKQHSEGLGKGHSKAIQKQPAVGDLA